MNKTYVTWTVDSGATSHMTNRREIMVKVRKVRKSGVRSVAGECLPFDEEGIVIIPTPHGDIVLERVIYVPGIKHSLLSQIMLGRTGIVTTWRRDSVTFALETGGELRYPLKPTDNRLEITSVHIIPDELAAVAYIAPILEAYRSRNSVEEPHRFFPLDGPSLEEQPTSKWLLLHETLGHPGPKHMQAMASKLLGSTAARNDNPPECGPCAMAKMTKARLPASSSEERLDIVLGRLHIDLITQNTGHSTYHYALVIVDEATSYKQVVPIVNKGQATQALIDWVALAEKQTGKFVKIIRSDHDSVFKSNVCLEWKAEKGILWEKSTVYDTRGNGMVERANRTLRERMSAMLAGRHCPYSLWPEAMEQAANCLNLTPRASDGKIPYEEFWGKDPKRLARFLKPFGCLAWVFVPERKRAGGKGGPKAIPAMYLGVGMEHRGYKFYSPHASPTTFWSNSAHFYPEKGWKDRRSIADAQELIDHEELFADKGNDIADLTYSPIDIIVEEDERVHRYYDRDVCEHQDEADVEIGPDGTLRAVDDDPRNIDSDDYAEWVSFATELAAVATTESKVLNLSPSVREALNGPNAAHWREAIRQELAGLKEMGTWIEVDLPPGVRLIDSKLVLRIKCDENGIPIKYKARLVARGFTQVKDLDYDQTFAPVAPYAVVRAVLSIATANKWFVHATDFTQAYLNGSLEHAIYMRPPEGASTPAGKVLKVVKGLYGLKQSGRVWNQELDKLLRSIGFMPLQSAACVYLRGNGNSVVLVAAYVDDLVITSPSEEAIAEVKASLLAKYKMEDKGAITSFCGIKIEYDQSAGRTVLSQNAFLSTLINEASSSIPAIRCRVPLSATLPEEELDKAIQPRYRSLVGKIMWLANHSRPDLSFAAGILARHLASPSQTHLDAALKVVAYLKSTENLSLNYDADKTLGLVGYSDANWASDPHAKRKSTTGYGVYLYGCLISWRSSLQRCTTLSALEAEIVAASEAGKELVWFRNLMRDMGIDVKPSLLVDSLGCTQVAHNPAQTWKLKHVDARYLFLRSLVQEGEISVNHTPGVANPSDVFTKPVGHHVLDRHRPTLGLR